jgi:hypothetical protein
MHAPSPNTLLVIALAVVVVGVMVLSTYRRRQRMRSLAEAFDGQSGELEGLLAPRITGQFRGREAILRYRPGSRYRSQELHVLIAARATLTFRIGREGLGARIGKGLQLVKDATIGDPELDQALTFAALEVERLAGWIRGASGVRQAITAAFGEHGVNTLGLDDGRLWVVRKGWRCFPKSAEDLGQLLECMRGLAEAAERA